MAGPKAGSPNDFMRRERPDRAPLGRVSRASECAGIGGTTEKQPVELDQGTTDTRREVGSAPEYRRLRLLCGDAPTGGTSSTGHFLLGTRAEQDTR